MTGAFTGAVGYGIGNAFQAGNIEYWQYVAGNAALGGVTEELNGGRFGHGFVSAGLWATIAPQINTGNDFGDGVAYAMLGGTTSVISGGKFGNGAATGALQFAMGKAGERAAQNRRMEAAAAFDYEDAVAAGEYMMPFIRDEGLNVLGRTMDVVGGAGQVALGGVICTGVVTCAGGAALAVQGASNIYEGWTGNSSLLRSGYHYAFGGYGDLAYGAVDIGTSVYGLTRKVLKPGSWKLFHYTNDQYVPAVQGITATRTTIEAAGMASDVRDLYEVNR